MVINMKLKTIVPVKRLQKCTGILLMLTMILGLCACNNNQTAEQPILAVENYPVVDGSTANLPMMAKIMERTCGISADEATLLTTCAKTPEAWINLAEGRSDLLLVYEAAEVTKQDLAEIGTELDITPIGRDALVFIVNENNPVDNLTSQQLIDIYTGKITNWREVGGTDLPIKAFQRPESSGSQSLFMKLLMANDTPTDAPTEFRPSEMGDLIEVLASYNNSADALGYSVFYYASYMYTQPGLKFVAVDGVLPSDETIADGSYPLLNEYYLAVRADEPADSNTGKLKNWILSEAGTKAIKDAGYIPLNK